MTEQVFANLIALVSGFLIGWRCGAWVYSYTPTRSPRLDPGRVQRGNGSGGPYQPKPHIIPKGQRARIPNPPPSNP